MNNYNMSHKWWCSSTQEWMISALWCIDSVIASCLLILWNYYFTTKYCGISNNKPTLRLWISHLIMQTGQQFSHLCKSKAINVTWKNDLYFAELYDWMKASACSIRSYNHFLSPFCRNYFCPFLLHYSKLFHLLWRNNSNSPLIDDCIKTVS